MIVPKFVYNPGSGSVTFTPTYPPINKEPEGELTAARHDSLSSTGLIQMVNERTDFFLNLDFAYAALADMVAWQKLLGFALAGGTVTYYPDSTLSASNDYVLNDTDWKTPRLCLNTFSFKLKLRRIETYDGS